MKGKDAVLDAEPELPLPSSLKLSRTSSSGSCNCRIDTKNGNKIALKVIDLDELCDSSTTKASQSIPTTASSTSPPQASLVCSEDDISDVMQEITALANCDCPQITKYYDSMLLPGSSKLVIAMELMSCSGADLVLLSPHRSTSHCMLHTCGLWPSYSCRSTPQHSTSASPANDRLHHCTCPTSPTRTHMQST